MRNKIIWLIPCLIIIVSLMLRFNIILIFCLTLLSIIICLLLSKKKEIRFLKTINVSNLSNQKTGILVGKKQNNIYLTDESKVLIIDKKSQKDYLNSNINIISSFSNKPNMIIIDPNRELYNKNYDNLKKSKYEITSYNLSNTFIDVFKIITKKMYAVKDLELKVNNIKGQYVTADEIFLAYEDIRKEIKQYKNDITKLINEFIICYYSSVEFLTLRYLLLTYIEKKIYTEKIVELTIDNVLEFIYEKSQDSVLKIRKYWSTAEDSEFNIKEEVTKLKVKNNDLLLVLNSLYKKTCVLKETIKNMKIIDLEGFYTTNQVIFISGEDEGTLKLFLFLLNYTHIESDLFLLLNSNAFYEFTLDKLKVIHVMTELKQVDGLDNYSVKIYRGKPVNENKKEVLRLCKKELDEIEDNDYENIFNFLKLFDKLDIDKDEVLIINPRKGNVIINFDFPKKTNKLLLNYKKN